MPPTELRSEMHALRDSAHKVFDRLWDGSFKYTGGKRSHNGHKARWVSRDLAYRWLAHHLGVAITCCHFSTLSEQRLLRALALCRNTTPAAIAAWRRQHDAGARLTQPAKPHPRNHQPQGAHP